MWFLYTYPAVKFLQTRVFGLGGFRVVTLLQFLSHIIHMGKRGPKNTPTELKILRGNPGKRPLNKSEPKPKKLKSGLPPKEFNLNARAKKIYKNLYSVLNDIRLLTEADVFTLARYTQELDEYLACNEFLSEKRKEGSAYGYVSTNKHGGEYFIEYLEVKIRKYLNESLKKTEAEFGFTPAARTSLSISVPDEEKKNLKNKLFGT